MILMALTVMIQTAMVHESGKAGARLGGGLVDAFKYIIRSIQKRVIDVLCASIVLGASGLILD